jgi:hypothetical protein
MTHRTIKLKCESLGLQFNQKPGHSIRSYEAVSADRRVRVYWTTSTEGGLLGLPRVIVSGVDTHARSPKEIEYLVKQSKEAGHASCD